MNSLSSSWLLLGYDPVETSVYLIGMFAQRSMSKKEAYKEAWKRSAKYDCSEVLVAAIDENLGSTLYDFFIRCKVPSNECSDLIRKIGYILNEILESVGKKHNFIK
jgi:hypothetical protein